MSNTKKKKIIIGIPKGFYSYKYRILWSFFLKKLGLGVITSKDTNSNLFLNKSNLFEKDLCIPTKIYLAHIQSLINQCDFQFIPIITKLLDGLWSCPKIISIADLAQLYFEGRIKILRPTIHINKKTETLSSLKRVAFEIGFFLNIKNKTISDAYKYAIKHQNIFYSLLTKYHYSYSDALSYLEEGKQAKINNNALITIGIIAHPYVLYDDYINLNIRHKFESMNIRYITPDNISTDILIQKITKLNINANQYWISDLELLGAYQAYADNPKIDGIIYLNMFSCAIDSVIEEYVNKFQKDNRKPYLKIVLDEHTLSSGINIRIMAFLDMILINQRKNQILDELKFPE